MNQLDSGRQYIIGGIIVFVALIYIIRLFEVQVINTSYMDSAENNSSRYVVQYPGRGLIYDRSGKTLLVYNAASYDLLIIPRQVKAFDTVEFCDILQISKKDLEERIRKSKGYSYYKPSILVKQLSAKTYANLQEVMFKLQGFSVQRRTARTYPEALAPHVLGYVGEVNENDIKKDGYYKQGDYIGKTGIEQTYEKELRGKKGVKVFLVDVHNRIQGSYKNGKVDRPAISGKDLICTIDADLQKYGEKLMTNKKGSIVAIEPSTGEILSLVSSPGYNPNLLVGRVRSKNYRKLTIDTLKPLFNRAAMASYPPGSTFKLVNALIALNEQVITTQTRFTCAGGYHTGSFSLGCHHYTSYDLIPSIQHSCNAYYCNAFRRILDNKKYENVREGYIKWKEYVNSFGLGKKLHTDLTNELIGLIPSANYFDRKYGGPDRWTSLMLVSMSIGQGEIGVTPIQMANMAALIANRGYYHIPHLIKKIHGTDSIDARFTQRHYTTIKSKYFEPVIEGMELVVLAGTARSANIEDIEVCGKTGTAQNPHGADHSIFIAFAPKDNPKIAISVYVENAGFGSTWAAPIARLMMEKYLKGKVSDKWPSSYYEKKMLEGDLIFGTTPTTVPAGSTQTTENTHNE